MWCSWFFPGKEEFADYYIDDPEDDRCSWDGMTFNVDFGETGD